MGNIKSLIVSIVFLLPLVRCTSDNNGSNDNNVKDTTNTVKINVPKFNADTAYAIIEKQVSFGHRIPGTVERPNKAHDSCAAFLISKLTNYGLKVITQKGEVMAFNGAKLNITNIFAQYKPESKQRILLLAHWDTRPFADKETDEKLKYKPIDGADDAGSGVAVLLEIARVISSQGPTVGVDILLVDAEDYGQINEGMTQDYSADTWCLGTQYWATHIPVENYHAKFGVLLDMVGAKGAVFPKEGSSMKYASAVVNKVWKIARGLGYTGYFNTAISYPTTDDHVYVNKLANIPTIDIVNFNPTTNNYAAHHHTLNDNISVIDKNTLNVVGQTLLQVLFLEK